MTALRRLLTFVALVAVSLTLAWLLSGDRIPMLGDAIREVTGQPRGTNDAIVVENPDNAQDTTKISFPGQFEFDVMRQQEAEDGSIVEHVAYRVHMMSGEPAENGDFLANKPTITFLDDQGAAEGTVTADEARFAMTQSVGGSVTVTQGQMSADHFTLTGNVRGDFPLENGDVAHLAAGELIVDGDLVQGPGLVTWTRPNLKLEGTDFTWDGETGRLNYVIDALLVLGPTPERAGIDLFAPGGLTWTIPPDVGDTPGQGYGELRGRVSGVSADGSRLGADTVFVHTSTIIMQGASVYERREGADLYRVTARQITVQPDDDGVFSFAEADGNVHVVSAPFAVMPAWMVTDHLIIEDDDVSSDGEVKITKGDLTVTGTGLQADLKTGEFAYEQDAIIDIDENSASAHKGLFVTARGGLEMAVPPETASASSTMTGKLRGGVTGTLPDGSTFKSDVLIIDGPHQRYVLDGQASLYNIDEPAAKSGRKPNRNKPEEQLGPGDTEQSVEAQRITIVQDDDGEIALVSADGDVVVLSSPVDLLPTRVVAGRLDLASPFVTSPGEVTWTRGDLTVHGAGMTYNQDTGRLDLDSGAVMTVFDPQRRVETMLMSDGGLTWHAAASSMSPFAEGHGELRGPVTGRSSDGSTLKTETLLIDDAGQTMRLLGPSTVAWPSEAGAMAVSSTELLLEGFGENARVTSDKLVDWARPDMKGRGRGLVYEEATGKIDITENADLEFGGASGRTVNVTATGGFSWNQPAVDGQAGFGQMRGLVQGRTSDGGTFITDTLWMDGRTNHIQMRGRSRYERVSPAGSVRLDATRRIDLELDPGGALRWLEAEGAADAWIWPTDLTSPGADVIHVTGDRLVVDQLRNEVTSYGKSASYENTSLGETTGVKATESIHVRTNAANEMKWLRAVQDVECITGSFQANCRRLVWNLVDDHATLTGDCRLFTGGAWVTGPLIDLWPTEGRWHIPESTIQIPDSQ